MARHQPAAVAGMEGLFNSEKGAPLVLMGQPDIEAQKIDNPIVVNKVLSFLIYGTTAAEVEGLNQIPRDQWPSALPLLFYSYHIMAGLGTYFVLLMGIAAFLLWRGRLFTARWILWPILLSFPLPYIANTAGWMTAEIGRQPWLVYGLIRTSQGYSTHVGAGSSLFTLLGFLGMYAVLSVLWIVLVYNFIQDGPQAVSQDAPGNSNDKLHRRVSMGTLWFWIVAVMLVAYVVLDGFDIGVGIVYLFVARTEEERQQAMRSIGPFWDGNEVWLLAAGGTLFFAFPLLYASAFSGFYLPLMIVLWLLILRALSIELRGHSAEPLWRTFFDALFTFSSSLLAIFYGAALANVVRGVPIGPDAFLPPALDQLEARPPSRNPRLVTVPEASSPWSRSPFTARSISP